ncbi:hypothetical protein JI735_14900 [Paenibacillus sonchi]|uniref:Uncharacterized protein n=1 Tax=Paenibacillus sonchi TaxID=373687 RepID=A0A974PGK9_9BACL|nr:hypothetical protein [Paenibacillus sonchi]QQZ63619.1 hypothetical protein JI735_14900 [Paenibacillus sonchi]
MCKEKVAVLCKDGVAVLCKYEDLYVSGYKSSVYFPLERVPLSKKVKPLLLGTWDNRLLLQPLLTASRLN